MHALACRPLLIASRSPRFLACRVIAGRRFPSASRSFRAYLARQNTPRDDPKEPAGAGDDSLQGPPGHPPAKEAGAVQGEEEVSESTEAGSEPPDLPTPPSHERVRYLVKTGNGPYGSYLKRSVRNVGRKAPETLHFEPPEWFMIKNVHLSQELGALEPQRPEPQGVRKVQLGANSYDIDGNVLLEITASARAGLRPTASWRVDSYPATKPHLVLQSPKNGGMFFLDAVVRHVARSCTADVVCIDAQDIAQIAGRQGLDVPSDSATGSAHSLGYDTHLVAGPSAARTAAENEGEEEGEEEEVEENDEDLDHHPRPGPADVKFTKVLGLPKLGELFKNLLPLQSSSGVAVMIADDGSTPLAGDRPNTQGFDDVRTVAMIEGLIDAARTLRQDVVDREQPGPKAELNDAQVNGQSESSAEDRVATAGNPASSEAKTSQRTIIHVQDYAEMNATRSGGFILSRLHDLVQRRRREGQEILIIGTTSSEDLIPTYSKSGFKTLQNYATQGPYRVIVTPCVSADADDVLDEDERVRIRQINTRNLQDMLQRLGSNIVQTLDVICMGDLDLDSALVFSTGMDEAIWPIEMVHRTASMALGMVGEDENMTVAHVSNALKVIESSDDAKFEWLAKEKRQTIIPISKSHPDDIKKAKDERMKKLRTTCNTHEKKLLSGVIDASSLHTTFSDVRAPVSTIDALKTLTSLSLVRPDAFTYGVLATEKIPGLLLYGPPGTGKTLLAKAVAKESGATVLEVSGSDVYDMYVGEGEKNVRAIFSLAKKLTPCVVFIDEADAIFGSRGTSGNRTSHRELINQFLREWDGMNELSAFIMVATNRPFDLDDAVLRRLPRRLLVDLPTEKDREAILCIHLRDEILDPAVSLSDLAARTPFYSGSDLKNVAVAAALACVREENDAAAAHTGPEAYQYPEKRTLTNAHFEKAMAEISASVSEDMSSLTAIRKFDEKYGDRRGRRKRPGGYGFGNLTEKEKERQEEGRVRKDL